MLDNFKLRLAAWIVGLRIVKWAHRVEGERAAFNKPCSFGSGWLLGKASIDGSIVACVRSSNRVGDL